MIAFFAIEKGFPKIYFLDMLKIVAYLFVLVPLLSFHPPVFADPLIVINEFASDVATGEKEWVEFYNFGSSDHSLAGWELKERTGSDLSGVDSHSLDSVTVPANGFAIYEFSSSKLNNSGDVLTLMNGSTKIDEIAYGSAPNSQVAAPDKSQSAGRKTDGSSNWVIFSSSTKHSTNNAGQVLPDPTPTPIPTPSPSSSTSQSTSSSKSPTPTPKPSLSTLKLPSPTPQNSPEVLAQKDQANSTASPASSPTESTEGQNPSKVKIASMLVGSGLILIGFSVAFYLWYRRTINSPKEEKEKSED